MARTAATFYIISTFASIAAGRSSVQVDRLRRGIGESEVTAARGQWPFVVTLTAQNPVSSGRLISGKSFCKGSIITDSWVVTAHHCFKSMDGVGIADDLFSPKNWVGLAGDIDGRAISKRDVFAVDRQPFRFAFVRITVVTRDNDIIVFPSRKSGIALMQTDRDLPLAPENPEISAVPLPLNSDTNWPITGTKCVIQGSDCTGQDDALVEIAVDVLPTKDCGLAGRGVIGDDHICAGLISAGQGICKVYSGSPLICRDGATQRQAGLISNPILDIFREEQLLFIRTSSFLDEIYGVIKTE